MYESSSDEIDDEDVTDVSTVTVVHAPTTAGHPQPAPRNLQNQINRERDVGTSGGGYSVHSAKSNYSGSGSGSPTGTSRAASFEYPSTTKIGGSSFDTASISSGLSVPPAGSYENGTPRHDRYATGSNHSRSNSFRGSDRSPRPERRTASPSPSIISDKEREDIERLSAEEEDRRTRLQIYVFVLRCIAFPFNAKQPHDMQKRQAKINKQDLPKIKERFAAFLNGETAIMADEAFKNAVQSYYEVFLTSDRVTSMVRSGACSANDFRGVFKNNIEKRVRSLPEIDGLSKETVLSSWMTKFDTIYRGDDNDSRKHMRSLSTASELILSKDQLYEMFQNILNVKKFEHLTLYNLLQLDNPDEQAAQVRRELASRQLQIDSKEYKQKPWKPKFVVKEMDLMHIDEMNSQIMQLKANLEGVPVKGGSLQKNPKKTSRPTNAMDAVEDDGLGLTKLDVVLSFTIEVVVSEVKGLKSSSNKNIYCTMEMDGGEKLQTGLTPASKPFWGTQGDFTTTQPLPAIKVRLLMESSGVLSIEDKELGKVVLKPTAAGSKQATWYKMITPKHSQDDIQIKIILRMDKPQNMKYCGFLFALGKKVWRTCKKRYFVLVQVSQYTFAVCSYKERKAEPTEILQLKGYTVDYCEHQPEMNCDAKYFFNAVKEGDSVTFATNDETERHNWVQAFYRATGQSHKPSPPVVTSLNGSKTGSLPNVAKLQGEIERARKTGFDEFVLADPCNFGHAELFKYLQHLCLEYRISDAYTCLGWFSPGQIYILDEYAARYCVRGCHRHLCYLSDLLDKAENGLMVDPTLVHYSFAFCASHVFGNKPDGLGTITNMERIKFDEVRSRLRTLLEHQITYFRYCFPFGRPEGALKATLSLLERVLMKDMASPVAVEEVRGVIIKCLENAALVNYTRLSEFAKLEDAETQDNPEERLADITNLANLCIEVLQQNEEHHAEAFSWFSDLLVDHNEMFWSLFAVDMDACLEALPPDSWDSFALFSLLNTYLLSDNTLRNGKFHKHLRDSFAPLTIRYVDLMELSLAQSIDRGFSKERWEPCEQGCSTSVDLLHKLGELQTFIRDLQWPEEVFAEHLELRLKRMACDMLEAAGNRTLLAFDFAMTRTSKGTDFLIPSEVCVMVNTLSDFKVQAVNLCMVMGENMHQYHTRIEEFLDGALQHTMGVINKRLTMALETVFSKLKRFDEGSFLKSLLSLTKPTDELGKVYVAFMRANVDMLRQKMLDELYINTLFERWYEQQMKMICQWLADRLEMPLHSYQLTCLIHIIRKCHSDFELQGVPDSELNTKVYQTICSRLDVEETTQAVLESRNARVLTGVSVDEEQQ